MITVTPHEDNLRLLHESFTQAIVDVAVGIRLHLELFGDRAVQTIKNQPPQGHPPGGPHPGPGELPVFGRHAYIDRTGYLSQSITSHRLGDRRLQIMASAPYAEDVEYGTPRSRPYPFFWPVVHELEPTFEPAIGQAVEDALIDLQQALA